MRHRLRSFAVLLPLVAALMLGTAPGAAAEDAAAGLPNLRRELSDRGLSFLERHEGFVGHL
jgi:hypothetical protein